MTRAGRGDALGTCPGWQAVFTLRRAGLRIKAARLDGGLVHPPPVRYVILIWL